MIPSTSLRWEAMLTYCSNLTFVVADLRGQMSATRNRVAAQDEVRHIEGPETQELEGEKVARPVPGAPFDAECRQSCRESHVCPCSPLQMSRRRRAGQSSAREGEG